MGAQLGTQVQGVNLYLDDALVGYLNSGGMNFDLDTTHFANGLHTVYVGAVDIANNETLSSSITLDFENSVRWLDACSMFNYFVPIDVTSDFFPADWLVTVTDANGTIVRTITGSTPDGNINTSWDGNDDFGQPLPVESLYQITVDVTETSSSTMMTASSLTSVTSVPSVSSKLNSHGVPEFSVQKPVPNPLTAYLSTLQIYSQLTPREKLIYPPLPPRPANNPYRLLNPLHLLAVNGILALIAILAMPGSPNGGPLALLLFAVLSFLSGMSQRFKRWQELNSNIRSHSYYIGTSPFEFAWLPEFCRRNRRVERFLDPIVCALVGLVILHSLPALALWIGFSALCLRVFEHAVFMRQRNRDLDIFDSIAISQRAALVFEQTEHTASKGQPPQQGIAVGLGPDIAEQVKLRKMKKDSMKCQLQTTTTCTGTAAHFLSNTANKQQKQTNSNNMSTPTKLPAGTWTKAFELADKMQPLKVRKSPAAAAVIGFAFGGIGLGIYFGTILDFAVPFTIFLILFIFGFTNAELALLLLPFLCAIWGYKRAAASNARLDANTDTSLAVVPPVIPQPSELQRN